MKNLVRSMFQLAIGTNITRPKSKGPKDEVGRAVLSAGHFLQTHPHHVFLLVSGGGRILTAHASSQALVPGLPSEWL